VLRRSRVLPRLRDRPLRRLRALLEPRTTWRERWALRIPIGIKLSIAITFMIWLTILTLSGRSPDSATGSTQTMRTGTVSLILANDARCCCWRTTRCGSTPDQDSASVEGLVYASIVDRAGSSGRTPTPAHRLRPGLPAAEESRTEGATPR
jgi:hypothetical protein